MRKSYHFRPSAHGLYAWDVERLIAMAEGLPTELVPLAEIAEVDSNWWYEHESQPTVRSIVRHMQQVADVELSYPVILDPDGGLMDGMHRVAKALLLGVETIAAKRLPTMPEPDLTDHRTDDPPPPCRNCGQ